MAGLLSSLLAMVGLATAPAAGKDPRPMADIYRKLREQALTARPEALGLRPEPGRKVWGVVMDMGTANGVASVVALKDGTVSLYFSGGGGIIGLGQHEGPRRAGEALIRAAQDYVSGATRTKEFPLPRAGRIRFFFLTFDGVFTSEAKEEDLGERRLPLSALFYKAQDVITQARLQDEQRRKQSGGG